MDHVVDDVLYPGEGAHVHPLAQSLVRRAIDVAQSNFLVVLGRQVIHVYVHLVSNRKGRLFITGHEIESNVLKHDDPFPVLYGIVERFVSQHLDVGILTMSARHQNPTRERESIDAIDEQNREKMEVKPA